MRGEFRDKEGGGEGLEQVKLKAELAPRGLQDPLRVCRGLRRGWRDLLVLPVLSAAGAKLVLPAQHRWYWPLISCAPPTLLNFLAGLSLSPEVRDPPWGQGGPNRRRGAGERGCSLEVCGLLALLVGVGEVFGALEPLQNRGFLFPSR